MAARDRALVEEVTPLPVPTSGFLSTFLWKNLRMPWRFSSWISDSSSDGGADKEEIEESSEESSSAMVAVVIFFSLVAVDCSLP